MTFRKYAGQMLKNLDFVMEKETGDSK